MMQHPRNPVRRSRNIGTVKQGHGRDNRLVIPQSINGPHWRDRLGSYSREIRVIDGRSITFLVEETTGGCIHPCTVSDVTHILRQVPASEWAILNTFVFRQPTIKQRTLVPVWGRLLYFAEITSGTGQKLSEGPAIILEAIDIERPIKWSKSLDPDDAGELERLSIDGHTIDQTARHHEIIVSRHSARNTQLYRTLLHEIGHWFDWLSKVEEPAMSGGTRESLERAYFARPKAEREAFAHRYAEEARKRLASKGVIPFDQIA